MGQIKGKVMLLQMGTVELASQRELSFEISDEMLDTTVKGDSAKKRIPLGEYDINLSIGGLYETGAVAGAGVNDLITSITNGTKATLLITSTTSGAPTYEVDGYVNNVSVEMNKDDIVTYSADFVSSGELTTGTVV
jgi:hypothetical protein